jgi:uncharacterized protein (TIGR00290 family)
MNIGCSWSGGKDSCYALMLALQENHHVKAILNMMNENGKISRSHGLPLSILEQQADALHVPLYAQPTSWNDYQEHFIQTLKLIHKEQNIEAIVFGDIDLQEHRDWEEMVSRKAGIEAILPLWKGERKHLVHAMIKVGIQAMIVSCNTTMGERFLGRMITDEMIIELEKIGVDVCGENGEFHTVVVNCPLFEQQIKLPFYTKVLHENYWFLDWS